MRFLTAVAVVALLTGPAYAQMPPLGIPMGGGTPQKPVDPVKENEYNKALHGLPSQKAADPWGNVRSDQPAAGAKKAPAAGEKDKKATGTTPKKPPPPKDAAATPGKDAGAGKKTN